jgi:hypothetical protein
MPARIDENKGRSMLAHELRQAVINLGPGIAGHDRFQRRAWNLEGEITIAHMTAVDDGASGRAIRTDIACADEESGYFLNRLLSCREADTRQVFAGQGFEPLETIA